MPLLVRLSSQLAESDSILRDARRLRITLLTGSALPVCALRSHLILPMWPCADNVDQDSTYRFSTYISDSSRGRGDPVVPTLPGSRRGGCTSRDGYETGHSLFCLVGRETAPVLVAGSVLRETDDHCTLPEAMQHGHPAPCAKTVDRHTLGIRIKERRLLQGLLSDRSPGIRFASKVLASSRLTLRPGGYSMG